VAWCSPSSGRRQDALSMVWSYTSLGFGEIPARFGVVSRQGEYA
jgi:hypothetical protein